MGRGVLIDAQKRHSRSRACFSAKNAVQSAFVSLLVLMATNKLALAIITGKPREEVPSALNFHFLPLDFVVVMKCQMNFSSSSFY